MAAVSSAARPSTVTLSAALKNPKLLAKAMLRSETLVTSMAHPTTAMQAVAAACVGSITSTADEKAPFLIKLARCSTPRGRASNRTYMYKKGIIEASR